MPNTKSQPSRLEHIILSCRRRLKGVYVASFTLYFDDSGTHLESPVAIAAAWVAPVQQWKRFELEWERVKKKETFKCFHTAECVVANSNSEFSTWGEDKIKRVVRRLVQLSLKTSSKGFAVAVHKKDYDDLVSAELKQRMGRYHYTWAVRTLIGMIEKWREGRSSEPTEYIFDRMPEQKGQIEKKREIELIFAEAEYQDNALHRYGIYKGCHSFRDRCEVTPLQAADLLAWCAFQRGVTQVTAKAPNTIAVEAFNDFVRNDRADMGMCSRDQLADLVAQCRDLEASELLGFPTVTLEGNRPRTLSRQRRA